MSAASGRALRLLTPLLLVVGLIAAGSATLQVVRHVQDAQQINHVAGSWIALTQAIVMDGQLYPPLHDPQTGLYSGTRLMPLGLLLNAAAAGFTGEYVTSGKLVSAAVMLLLLAVMLCSMRQRDCPWSVALAIIGCFLITQCALREVMSIRGDTLPIALQLGALLLLERSTKRGQQLTAACLCAVAFFFKLSAIWAPLAGCVWLWVRLRRVPALFIVTGVVLGAAFALLVQLLSDGRMFETLMELAGSGLGDGGLSESGSGWEMSAPRLVAMLRIRAVPMLPLLVLAAVALIQSMTGRRLELPQLALVIASGVLLFVLADSGADYNHLLDVLALSAVVVGRQAGAWRNRGGALAQLPAGVLLVGLALGLSDHWTRGLPPVRGTPGAAAMTERSNARATARKVEPVAHPMAPMTDALITYRHILSEDPYVPISLGQRAVISDPWMLLRLETSHPEITASLVERITHQEFDVVVLFERITTDATGTDISPWYRDGHLGPRIAHALENHYVPNGTALGFELYVPRDD